MYDSNNEQTAKMYEFEDNLNSNKIDVIAVNEFELHGQLSRVQRATPVTNDTINHNLNMENFCMWLPNQWKTHQQARTVIYTRNNMTVNQVKINSKYDDLPIVILDMSA